MTRISQHLRLGHLKSTLASKSLGLPRSDIQRVFVVLQDLIAWITDLPQCLQAAQYNGQSAVIKGFDKEAGRYMVQLKNGKDLKIKRDNMELVDGAVKGGFLSQKQCTKARYSEF